MDADLNSIILGYTGKCNMLQMVFGEKKEKPKPKPKTSDVKSFAQTHNALISKAG